LQLLAEAVKLFRNSSPQRKQGVNLPYFKVLEDKEIPIVDKFTAILGWEC
jgi:hypothetical protein